MNIHCYNRCATGEAWPSIMLSCAPPKPCDPRVNPRNASRMEYITQPVISSLYNTMRIDTNASSTVNLYEDIEPRVLASSGKLQKVEKSPGASGTNNRYKI